MNRTLAWIFSAIGHPLFVLSYVTLLMLAVNPFLFGARNLSDPQAVLLLFSVVSTSTLIPAVGVALMRPLGFVKSFSMEDKQERIGPYIVSGVFYLWLFKNLLSTGSNISPLLAEFTLGATIGLFLAFFINIFTKISAHAVGMGGLITMLAVLAFNWSPAALFIQVFSATYSISLLAILVLGVLLAGLVGASRLALQAHTPADLYRGYLAGIVSVLTAVMIL